MSNKDDLRILGEVKPGKCDIRLSDADMGRLEKIAKIEEATKSDIMRRALRLLFKQYEK